MRSADAVGSIRIVTAPAPISGSLASVGGAATESGATIIAADSTASSGAGARRGLIDQLLNIGFELPEVVSLTTGHHDAQDKVRQLSTPEGRKQEHLPWPNWAVDKWRAEAKPLPRLIFEIGVGSVQRPGDWVGFTWGDYDGKVLLLRQNKSDKPLELPCTANLIAALDAAKDALGFAPLPSRPILCTRQGGAMSYRYMADLMLKERKRLGLEAYDLHALRYRGVKELAWSGCDDDEIASYSGHSTKAMIVKYAGEARQIMRARQARLKRQ